MNLKSILLVSALGIVGSANANVVISKFYGGGGNSGATYTNDFVELINNGSTNQSLGGLSLQYGSAAGVFGSTASASTISSLDLPTFTLQPGQYFLVQLGAGAGGTTSLPTPDASANIAASATNGKILLYKGTGPVNTLDPTLANQADLLGFGTANRFETVAAATLTNTTAAVRKNFGLLDTDNNSTDFEIIAADSTMTIHNSSSAFAPVPEPSAFAALGLGLVAIVRRRRRA